jgi:general secretion pathway protein E
MQIDTRPPDHPAPTIAAEAPSEILRTLLIEAGRIGASHIHVEPLADGVMVRMRFGNALHPLRSLPRDGARELIDWAEACLAQGGVLLVGDSEIAVTALPVCGGNRLVLRLDAASTPSAELEALGMRPQLAALLPRALSRGGLVLVAGPAQSGRSTTLAALLRLVASDAANLIFVGTRPLPALPAVTQSIAATGLPLAAALAGALAQDPDGIAVDAVEDRATAARAIEAADAGHLVLATIEARDAVGAVRRLREWRVEPFQLASNLRMVLGQRLVRRLCGECRVPSQAQGSVSALLGFDPGAIVYSPEGCEACAGSGFQGWTGVFEAVEADAAIRRLINDGGDEAILARHAFLRAPNLGSAARRLIREGVTTPEEAIRISRS